MNFYGNSCYKEAVDVLASTPSSFIRVKQATYERLSKISFLYKKLKKEFFTGQGVRRALVLPFFTRIMPAIH